MSHEITESDLVLGTERFWHGLNVIRPEIQIFPKGEDEEMDSILFDTIAFPAYFPAVRFDSASGAWGADETQGFTPSEDKKVIGRVWKGQFRPLSIMGADYASEINSRTLTEAVLSAMDKEGVKYTIESVGTLRDGKLFFMSLKLEERMVNGDTFRCYLNITQSFDGTVSITCYDSNTRIVCANTFVWSWNERGDLVLKVKKTKNASLAIPEMGKIIAATLAGHDAMQACMERLASVESNVEQAEALFAAWKSIDMKHGDIMSTRAFNQVVDLSDLFLRGKGNKGETLYDCANAVTEYYTSGQGSGSVERVSMAKRFASSEFGTAAGHKAGFVHWIDTIAEKPSKLKESLATGRRVLRDKRDAIAI